MADAAILTSCKGHSAVQNSKAKHVDSGHKLAPTMGDDYALTPGTSRGKGMAADPDPSKIAREKEELFAFFTASKGGCSQARAGWGASREATLWGAQTATLRR